MTYLVTVCDCCGADRESEDADALSFHRELNRLGWTTRTLAGVICDCCPDPLCRTEVPPADWDPDKGPFRGRMFEALKALKSARNTP